MTGDTTWSVRITTMEAQPIADVSIDVADIPSLSTMAEICDWAGISRPEMERLVHKIQFPEPVFVGEYPRWRRSELLNWLKSLRDKTRRQAVSSRAFLPSQICHECCIAVGRRLSA